MSDNLLTDIYDGIQAVYFFLSGELSREKLSRDNELKRAKYAQTLEGLLNKIQLHQPAHQNDINGITFKPPLPTPPPTADSPPKISEPDHEPTDYLAFEPSPLDGSEPQDTYEAMENNEQIPEELYEETQGADESSELYEEPVTSRPSTSNGSVPGMTPPGSRENSGSGVEYMEANRSRVQEPDAALEWSTVYQLPKTSAKVKVSQLEGVSIKGPLEKLGGKSHKTWQKRYCVLAGPMMYFYEKETSRTFNNLISVPTFSIDVSDKLSDKKHFAFKLTQLDHSGKKDYCFRTTSSDNRDKWVNAMRKVIGMSQAPSNRPGAVTLPRMPSSNPNSALAFPPPVKARSITLGAIDEPGEPQELYEPVDNVQGGEEEEEQDEYVPVSPDAIKEDLESSEEYIDVEPHGDEPTEVYEEPPITLQEEMPPPPPTSPPPGPPKEHPFPPSSSPIPPPMPPKPVEPARPPKPSPTIGKKPAPLPPEPPAVDTSRVYVQSTNGISLEKVFVSLWDFAAGEKDEINLKRGDLVFVKDPKENADWWYGELLDDEATSKLGKAGFFPRTYASHAFEAITA